MKKIEFVFVGIFILIITMIFVSSCSKEGFESNVKHDVTYVLVNNAPDSMEFYITYSDPAFANEIHLNYDTLRTWQYTINAQNDYKCSFNVYTYTENADFTISILQGDSVRTVVTAQEPHDGKTAAQLLYYVER
ncbi:MAG: hypothetical protein PHR53_07210 [Bacteroidales bacterium]|nr:hypothetical protein [Bacteroidales bacterium]